MSLAARVMALGAVCGCTTDLDLLVDDGIADAAVATPVPDGASPVFPPPHMEPTFEEPGEIVDPAGPFAFTLLHGVVDAPRVYFCLAHGGEPQGDPWPSDGLGYGEAWVGDQVEGIDLERDRLEIVVVAGDAALIEGRDCQAILNDEQSSVTLGASVSALIGSANGFAVSALGDGGAADAAAVSGAQEAGIGDGGSTDAGAVDVDVTDAAAPPPKIRVAFLPVVPAGTLSSQGSYLLTVSGCLSADYLTAQDERAVCGPSYLSDRPTLTAMLVRLSRLVTFGNPSLQFLQASLGAGTLTLRSVPGVLQVGTQVTIATDVLPGVLAPYPPLQSVAPSTFGTPLGSAQLQVESETGAPWSAPWAQALEATGTEQLEGLIGYTVVFMGPDPWLETEAEEPWWNEPRFSLVRNSP